MYDLFFQHFNKVVALTAEEEELIRPYLRLKKLRKKQYFLQEGDVCQSGAFVTKGLLRLYYVDERNDENIIQFTPEGWSVTDMYSFLTGEPSVYNIDALEDSELILIDRAAHEEMTLKFRKYETYARLQITRAYIALQRRLTSMISLNTEQRYEEFSKRYPSIVQRVPQHMIASYMGLTAETLSRVRNKITHKK